MSVQATKAKLMRSAKEFFFAWAQVRVHWHDEVSDQFERRFIAALRGDLRAVEQALDQINNHMERAEHDCDK